MCVNMWTLVLTLVSVLIFIYRHITRNFNHWKEQNVPYKTPVPIFGNVFKVVTLKQSLGQLAKELYDSTESKLIGFFVFDQPFLLVRDTGVIKNILIKDFEYFDNRTVTENPRDDQIGANLLFVMKNPAWKAVRGKLTPVFTSGKIKSMLHLMLEVCEDMKEYLNAEVVSGASTESREICMKYTTNVISSCAFGINAQSFKQEGAEFRAAVRRFFAWSIIRSTQMASYFIAPCLVRPFRMTFMEAKSSSFMRSLFLTHLDQRQHVSTKRGDLIDILLEMKKGNTDVLDDEIVVAQALQFFLAGFETTGNTISFALYELALNKTVQHRLREEIRTTTDTHGKLSYEAIMDMKYLDNVLSETLRKYPALTFLDRRCSKDYKIPDTNVTIKKGIPVYISLFGLHMDPKNFPQPDIFDPDRFSEENKHKIPHFSYMPFGDGPRNCIGARFGLLSAKTALITFISGFEFDVHADTPIPLKLDPKTGFLIAPEGGTIPLRISKYVSG